MPQTEPRLAASAEQAHGSGSLVSAKATKLSGQTDAVACVEAGNGEVLRDGGWSVELAAWQVTVEEELRTAAGGTVTEPPRGLITPACIAALHTDESPV